mgnify:CR=1 FL=1
MRAVRLAGVLLSLALLAGAQEAQPLWQVHVPCTGMDGSPAVADFNEDGAPEICVPGLDGSVFLFDGGGNELWRTRQTDVISMAPTAADVAPSPGPEALVLTNTGKVFCLAGATGNVLWEYALPGSVNWGGSAIAAADVDGDGRIEAVTADSRGTLVCLDGGGAEEWVWESPTTLNSPPTIADMDGDGAPEVLVGGPDAPVYCLSGAGALRWQTGMGGGQGTGPVVADLDNDGAPEILVGIDNDLACLDNQGQTRWRVAMNTPVDNGIAVGDADGDGAPEIYAADTAGLLVSVTPGGEVRWRGDVEERARRSPALADVDGDGIIEILVAGYSGAMHVFEPGGTLQERVDLGGMCNATATVAGLGDGRLSVVVPLVNAVLAAYQWPGGGGRVLWPAYRYGPTRTGAPKLAEEVPEGVRITEFATGAGYVGANKFSVRVENPGHKPLEVRMTVAFDGGRETRKTVEVDAETAPVNLPYVVSGGAPVRLAFSCVVVEDGAEVAARRQQRYIVPFALEMRALNGRLAELDALAEEAAGGGRLRREASLLRAALPGLRERIALAGNMNGLERRRLRDDVTELLEASGREAGLARVAAERGTTLAVFAANPWAPFGGVDELVEGRTGEPPLRVAAFAGETESAAANVFNLAGTMAVVRVEPGPFEGPGGTAPVPAADVLTVREAVPVPSQMRVMAHDALPALNQGRTVFVGAQDGRQLWFNIDTAALTPGVWRCEVRLRALDFDNTEIVLPIEATVWEVALPEEQPLRLCHWGYVHTSILKDQPEAALRDQAEHGTNVFVSLFKPLGEFDEEGALVGELDFSEHDAYLEKHAPQGRILFYTYQRGIKGPAPELSEAWKKAHVAYLRRWFAHLNGMGIGYDRFALYPVDEPGLREGLVERFIALSKLIRQADPNVRIYADPVGGASMEELERMAPYIDIWCPHRNGIVLEPETGKLDFILSEEETTYTYECQDRAKNRSPLAYYRAQAWLAWARGLDGIGFWSYCTSRYDPWYFSGQSEYLLVYQGDGVVPSKRWEAVRDGVEDYTMLALLRERTEAAAEAGRAAEAVAAARQLLGGRAEDIARYCGIDEDGDLPGVDGLPAVRAVAGRRWRAIEETRAEMARLLKELE